MLRTLIPALGIVALVTGCAPMEQQQGNTLLSLTDAHFRDTAAVHADPLDPAIVIDTAPGFQERKGLLGIIWNDEYLADSIDRKTGERTYAVIQVLRYVSDNWRFFDQANYATPSGPAVVPAVALNRQVEDCHVGESSILSEGSTCRYMEIVRFTVPETILRRLAGEYGEPDPAAHIWFYKVTAPDGSSYRDGFTPAEAKGLLERVDAWAAAARR